MCCSLCPAKPSSPPGLCLDVPCSQKPFQTPTSQVPAHLLASLKGGMSKLWLWVSITRVGGSSFKEGLLVLHWVLGTELVGQAHAAPGTCLSSDGMTLLNLP